MNWAEGWYGVVAISVLFYALLDGFDLGVGMLHLSGKNDLQRRMFLNAIGPVWDGNEVWIVIVMGGLFAGFPGVYATVFSGFYTLLMFLIAGLMFRAAAIEFRSKREGKRWRSFWDFVFFGSSILVACTLGLVVGNLIEGVPLNAQQDFTGSFSTFFRPYSILVALTSVAFFAMHGALYLLMKTEGETQETVLKKIPRAIGIFFFWYVAVTIATWLTIPRMTAWMKEEPWLFFFPLLTFGAILLIPYFVKKAWYGWAFLFSCGSIALLLILYVLGTYPILLFSTVSPETHSLTIYNTASSEKTLKILMTVVAIGVPLVLGYGYWVYRIFRGKVQLTSSSY